MADYRTANGSVVQPFSVRFGAKVQIMKPTLWERLTAANGGKPLNLMVDSKRLGVGQGTLQRIRAGDSSPRLDTLQRLADGLGVTVVDLVGTGEDVIDRGSQYLAGFEKLSIPLLANAASMGAGEELQDEVVVGSLPVHPSWVTRTLRHLSSPRNLRFLHGYGESMWPTFSHGDILLVDLGQIEVRVDGVYVLRANERLYIKRVRQRITGEYEISSDNPAVKTVDVLDGRGAVAIIGRVLWAWNGKGL